MAELKVGDKVLIRKDLKRDIYDDMLALGGMLELKGKICTIKALCHDNYFYLKEDKTGCYWSKGMLAMGANPLTEVKF